MIDGEQVFAGLLDPPRDAVSVQRAESISVFKTIRVKVPCQTSVLSRDNSWGMVLLDSQRKHTTALVGMQ